MKLKKKKNIPYKFKILNKYQKNLFILKEILFYFFT
jgi:hypothetical protein